MVLSETNCQYFLNSVMDLGKSMTRAVESQELKHTLTHLEQAKDSLKTINDRLLFFEPNRRLDAIKHTRNEFDGIYESVAAHLASDLNICAETTPQTRPPSAKLAMQCMTWFLLALEDLLKITMKILRIGPKTLQGDDCERYQKILTLLKDNINTACLIGKEIIECTHPATKQFLLNVIRVSSKVNTLKDYLCKNCTRWPEIGQFAKKLGLLVK